MADKDKRIEAYVDMLNQLFYETNTLLETEIKVYEIHEPEATNQIIGYIKFDEYKAKYYYVIANK